MRKAIISATAAMLTVLSAIATGAPTVTIYTDHDAYQLGDTIQVSLSARNRDPGIWVDVYVGLLTPRLELFTITQWGWMKRIGPLIEDIYVPSSFNMNRSPFLWLDVPCEMPPIGQEGNYWFAAGLTNTGTSEFISDISSALFAIQRASGVDLYVDSVAGDDSNDGSLGSPFRTITKALASANGSLVCPVMLHVAAGVYASSVNGESFPLKMKSWVSLVGAGPGASILSGGYTSGHVILCVGAHDLSVSGFTIRGGLAHARFGSSANGGGIYCSESSPVIENSTITGNVAVDKGGGIYCHSSSPIIRNSEITNNSAELAGGIYCDESSAIIENNTITGNVASDKGGGAFCYKGSPTIQNSEITNNSAELAGGGIYCYKSSPIIKNNTITVNSALNTYHGKGGGIYCSESSPRIENNEITNNSAIKFGGGIYFYKSWGAIDSNAISDNSLRREEGSLNQDNSKGAGIYCQGGSPTIRGNTITANFAEAVLTPGKKVSSHDIWCEGSWPTIENNVIVSARGSDGIVCNSYS